MPSSWAGVRLKGRSSTKTHSSAAHAGALGAELVHAHREGLRMPSSPEMTTPSKSSSNMSQRVAVHAPRVRHQRRADARPRRAMRTASTIAASGCTPANSPSIRPVGLDLEQRREAALELVLVQLAGLERDQQLARLGIGAEARPSASAGRSRRARSGRGRRRTGSSSARRPSRSAGARARSGARRGSSAGAMCHLLAPGGRARARPRRTASGRGRRWCRRSRACSCPP